MKYDKEKCARNVEEEDGLAMDGYYIALWKARRNCNFTHSQVRALEIRLKKAQKKVSKCIRLVAECKGQLRNVGLVCKIEHNIRHTKLAAADSLIRWVSENPAWESFTCDTVLSNALAANPTFSSFIPDSGTRLSSLASERYATLGTLKGGRVKEKGGCFGSHRTHLRTHW